MDRRFSHGDTLVMRLSDSEAGVEYLCLSLGQLLAIDRPVDWISQTMLGETRLEQDLIGPERIDALRRVMGDRWRHSGLVVPTPEECAALPMLSNDGSSFMRAGRNYRRYPGWSGFEPYDCLKVGAGEESRLSVVMITGEGRDWLPKAVGWYELRNMLANPEDCGGVLVGQGSEAKVYRMQIAGRDCAVRVLNEEAEVALETVRKEHVFGCLIPPFSRPNFLKRAGFLPGLMSIIKDVPQPPFDVEGARQHLFAAECELLDFVPGLPMDSLVEEIKGRKKVIGKEAQAFLRAHDLDQQVLGDAQLWFEHLHRVINLVRQVPRYREPLRTHDFYLGNVLVRGRDPVTRRLQFTLIDQGTPVSDVYAACDLARDRYDDYEQAHKTYVALCQDGRYVAFLAKYFPGGFPVMTIRDMEY